MEQRKALLSGLDRSCTNEDQVRWTEELKAATERRLTNPKAMDTFLDAAEQGFTFFHIYEYILLTSVVL
jgi:hypothetical protein